MTTARLPTPEPAGDPGALVDWGRVRERLGFAVRAVRRRPVVSACCFLAVACLGPLSLAVLPRAWRVEGLVAAGRDPVVSTLADPVLLRALGAEDPASAARDAILRRDRLAAVIEETKLLEKAAAARAPLARARDRVVALVTGQPRREERVADLVETLERKLTVTVPGTEPGAPPGAPRDRILIALEWPDPAVAKQVVEAAALRFLEGRRERERAVARDAVEALADRAETVRREIDGKVARIHELEETLLRGHPTLARTYRAPRGRVPQEAELAQVRETLESRKAALAELERLRQARLEEVQAELARQRAAYGAEHPVIARTREVLDGLAAPSPRAQAIRAEIAGLEQAFQRASERAARLVDDEDPALEYERADLRQLLARYATLRDRLDGAQVEAAIASAGFDRRYAFAVPPVLPRRPLGPSALVLVAASVLGGALLALFAAAVLDARSGTILERWQLERSLQLRVLDERDA